MVPISSEFIVLREAPARVSRSALRTAIVTLVIYLATARAGASGFVSTLRPCISSLLLSFYPWATPHTVSFSADRTRYRCVAGAAVAVHLGFR